MAEFEFDFTPYVVEALAKIDAMAEERLKEHFRQAFNAGKDVGYDQGQDDGYLPWEDVDDFEEWFAKYVEKVKRDAVRLRER